MSAKPFDRAPWSEILKQTVTASSMLSDNKSNKRVKPEHVTKTFFALGPDRDHGSWVAIFQTQDGYGVLKKHGDLLNLQIGETIKEAWLFGLNKQDRKRIVNSHQYTVPASQLFCDNRVTILEEQVQLLLEKIRG